MGLDHRRRHQAIGAYFATVAVLIIAIMLVRTIEPPWGSIIAATLLVVFLVLTVVLKARKYDELTSRKTLGCCAYQRRRSIVLCNAQTGC